MKYSFLRRCGIELIGRIGKWQCARQCQAEYANQRVERMNERPVEYSFLFRQIAALSRKDSRCRDWNYRDAAFDEKLRVSCHGD